MAKIVLIGAGSYVFGRDFIADIMLYPKLAGSTLMLMDIDKERLDLAAAFANKMVEQNKLNLKIESTTDRREALDGADYVITSIRAGGWKAQQLLREITWKRGLEIQPDAMGIGGIFGGLCQVPAILEICHDMEKVCPDAWLLNYCNPMAIICWGINDYSKIKNVGLCPNPTGGSQRFGRMLGLPPEDIWYTVGGLNHQSWFLEVKYKGEDLFPKMREKVKEMETSATDRRNSLENEMFKTFGYFDTGGSHLSISLPYFRRTPQLVEKYNVGSNDHMYSDAPAITAKQDAELRQQLQSGKKFELKEEHRYTGIAASIINAIETNEQTRIFGNVRNTGLIPNLLEGCVVEVPCMVDKGGVHPTYVGNLPSQLASLNRLNINVQELAVRGIVEKDKTKVLQAILLDPLTFSMLSIDEIKEIVSEIFKAEKQYMKGYK
jgi:Alpha-galactosidases/6-phospho-beta-glucosidases, family 4 of glycosyl hydrolases